MNEHGTNGKSDNSMADINDISRMEYVLKNPDEISAAGRTQAYSYMEKGYNRTAKTVLNEKRIGANSYYVVQPVPDTKKKTLYVVSAFIGKPGYKKEAPQLIDAKSPNATSKDGSVIASNDIISNNSEKINRRQQKKLEQKTNTTDDGGVKYSLMKDATGNLFVEIKEDILNIDNGESVARTIQKLIAERFNNLIVVNGQKIQINKTTNDEFRKSNSANMLLETPSQAYNDKLRTIANADEILKAAKNWIGEKTKHIRKDDIVEFARGNITYRVGKNGYVADILVGIRKNGSAVLYDLVNIYEKEIADAPVTMASYNNSQRRQETSATSNVPQKVDSVNNNSIQKLQKNAEIKNPTKAPDIRYSRKMVNDVDSDKKKKYNKHSIRDSKNSMLMQWANSASV